MPIRHTDVLVVGGELAGAVAAAVCARAGKRVVVLEEGEGDDTEVVGNVIAPPPGEIWPNIDLLPRAMGPLELLGQKQDLRRTAPLSSSALQVIHPEHRLDLFSDPAQRAADLRREAGEAGDGASRVLEDAEESAKAAFSVVEGLDALLPEGFFADRRTRSRYRESLGGVREVPAFSTPAGAAWVGNALQGALPFLAHAVTVPAWASQRLVRAALAGFHVSPVGVRNALRAQLLDLARQRGAEIIREERAAAFVVDSGRISEVRLAQRSDALSARVVIDATWSRDLRDRVSPEKHAKKLDAVTGVAPVKLVRTGILWAVRKEGIPPGLGDCALLAPDGEGPGSGTALLTCLRNPLSADNRKPNAGVVVLGLAAVAEEAKVEEACQRLTARLEALFPFTRRHAVEARSVGTSRFRISHGAIYGGPEDPVSLGGRGTDGGLKSLFRAGRDVAPILGIEGELWAGHAAGVLADRTLSKKPLFGASVPESTSGVR